MRPNDLFIPNPDDKLEDALALLAAGMPLAEVLTEAGDDAEWLRPLLQIADEVGELRATIPVPSPEVSLRRMLDYGQELAAGSPPAMSAPSGWQVILTRLFGGGLLPRLATGLATALLVVALLGGAVTVLAQRSLPGQPLYGLKRVGEALRLALTQDPTERERLLETYNQLRRQEAEILLEQGQTAQVTFEGRLEAVTATTITLDGLVVQLTSQTEINGTLAVGARVQVEVQTQPPDQLIALAVTVIAVAPFTPTPLPLPTSTSTPTLPPTAVPGGSQATNTLKLPTATPTSEQSRATDTLRPPTATPTPTSLPPLPTATPTVTVVPPTPMAIPPEGGDSSNTNDNGNDDSGDNDEGANGNEDNDNANDNNSDDFGGDDNSGPGGGGDDNSGSGSGSSGGGGDDNSGSGGGDDDHSGSGDGG